MASNLLKTLKKIDDGRLECIRIAKEMGYNVSEKSSLRDIASCLAQAGKFTIYPELDVDKIKMTRKKWVRPSDMYDLKPIYTAAKSFTGSDGNTYYPLYVMSFRTSYGSIQINKGNLCQNGTIAVKTSDGITYENADITTTSFAHTWDSSVTDKYYIVVYATEEYYNGTKSIQIATALNHNEILEIYAGAGLYGRWATNTNYFYVVSVIFDENTKINSSTTDFFVCSSSYIRNLVLNCSSIQYSSNGSGRYMFRNLNYLNHFEMKYDTSISGGSGAVFSGLGEARENGSLTYFDAPKLASITSYYSCPIGGDSSIIDLPELTNWMGDKSTTHTLKSPIVNLPKWNGSNVHSVYLDNVVIFNYKEGLQLSNLIVKNVPLGFRFDKTIKLSGNLTIECYQYNMDLSMFDVKMSNIYASKVENIKFPAINQSFDLSRYLMLSKASIIDVFDDLSTTDNSYVITLSQAQKDMLSESEMRIATDKGWVIE